jgi:hypothetical protein
MVARLEQAQHRIFGCQPTGERQPILYTLQRRQVALQHGTGGMIRTGIFVSLVLPRRRLRVGRSQIDRRHNGARSRIGLNARVNRFGCETH